MDYRDAYEVERELRLKFEKKYKDLIACINKKIEENATDEKSCNAMAMLLKTHTANALEEILFEAKRGEIVE